MFLVLFKYVESRVCTFVFVCFHTNKAWLVVEVGCGASNWFQGCYTKPDCMGLLEVPAKSLPLIGTTVCLQGPA